jgi:hypothetical protein
MMNLALIAVSLTLAAEPSASATTESATAAPPAAESATQAAAPEAPATPTPPASEAPAAAPAAAAPAPTPAAVTKPSEDDIEVLSDVVDLEEDEDPAAGWYGAAYPERTRILGLPTGRTVRAGGFDFIVDHRAASPIYNKDSAHSGADMWNNFLGFDSALTVGLGLRYGIIQGLDAGVYRVNGSSFDTYEFDVRGQLLRQEEHEVDVMVRAGLSWFSIPNEKDALKPFAQAFISRLFVNRLLATAGVMYHSDSSSSNSLTSPGYAQKYKEDKKWSVAGAVGLEYRFVASAALDAEVVHCTAGFCNKKPAFSAGLKYFTNKHTFALVCGNTQYLSSDAYITNTDTPWSKLVIGFNITREY